MVQLTHITHILNSWFMCGSLLLPNTIRIPWPICILLHRPIHWVTILNMWVIVIPQRGEWLGVLEWIYILNRDLSFGRTQVLLPVGTSNKVRVVSGLTRRFVNLILWPDLWEYGGGSIWLWVEWIECGESSILVLGCGYAVYSILMGRVGLVHSVDGGLILNSFIQDDCVAFFILDSLFLSWPLLTLPWWSSHLWVDLLWVEWDLMVYHLSTVGVIVGMVLSL